jgi:hypothetical protein
MQKLEARVSFTDAGFQLSSLPSNYSVCLRICGPWEHRADQQRRLAQWCPGPESNRHGVSPKGFSYSPQLSLLRAHARIWSLDFTFALSRRAI